MKVAKISGQNLSFQNSQRPTLENPFLYTPKEKANNSMAFKDHKWEYLGGFAAAALALTCIMKFTVNKSLPKSIIEIADPNKGLNKIENCYAVKLLKEKVLYPLKSVDLGNESLMKNNNFKTGVIICSKNIDKAEDLSEALIEHLEALGLKVFNTNKEKGVSQKVTHKVLNKANEAYLENQMVSVVCINRLDKITNFKPNKTRPASKLETRLINQTPGVMWVAYTDKVDDIPYFYNYARTLCVTFD